jgi:hypothetical protein
MADFFSDPYLEPRRNEAMKDDHHATALAHIDADFSGQGASLRHNRCDFQALRQKVLSLIESPR